MFSIVAVLAITLGFLHNGESLECYKCSAFGKDDPSECLYVDDKTKTETCKDDEKYCSAVGHKYVDRDGVTTYTNLRRCESDKYTCSRAYYAYGDNLRNCQVCATDKCNTAPLLSPEELEKQPLKGTGGDSNPGEDVPEDAGGGATDGAETDGNVGGGVSSK